MKKLIYLDHAAATPIDKQVLASMQPYFSDKFYNPSAIYLSAKSVRADIEKARADVASILGAKPSEIYFVAGGTESCNLAIKGVMDLHPGSNLVISAVEHDAVYESAKQYKHKIAPVDKKGSVKIEELRNLIDDKTVLVSIMYANNEIGTVEPIKEISDLIKAVRKQREKKGNKLPIYLHSDAAQAGAYLDLHVSRLGVDLMTLNGGKIYGPKQSGILYVNRQVGLKPQIVGGGQEWGTRSGTENVAGIIGFAKALELAQKSRVGESSRLQDLAHIFISGLEAKVVDFKLNGPEKKRLPNNLSLTFAGRDSEKLVMQLDELGVIAASGAACSANSSSISKTLLAIGLSEDEAKATLRLSMGRLTTKQEIKEVVEKLIKILG